MRARSKGALRRTTDGVAGVLVLPLRIARRLRLLEFATVSQLLSLVPGQLGRHLRRAWYGAELERCGRNLVVDFGAAIRTPRARIGNDVYIGLYNWVGLVDIGDDFLSGSHVVLLSGGRQHAFADVSVPMRLQPSQHERIVIGNDVWVGAHVVVLADVAPHSVLAAGAIVNRRYDDYDVLGGVPAKPIGNRRRAADPPL